MNLDLAIPFLKKILGHLHDSSFDISNWEIDHLCYRTESNEDYKLAKNYFSSISSLLIESQVGGRPIATYKLFRPIEYGDYIIDLIEVPAPKLTRASQKGFEHIEIVVDLPFQDLIDRYPKINFTTKGLAKEINPELEIEFKDCAVKFHHKSLEQIINIEKNQRVIEFLDSSQLLSKLAKYTPCLSAEVALGIEPLGLNLKILFCAQEIETFENEVVGLFGRQKNYSNKRNSQEEESVLISFKWQELTVEFNCSTTQVFAQRDNKILLTEGRILKLGGEKLKNAIGELRTAGIQNEAAFGEILNLKQPHTDLLKLSMLTDLEIKKRLKL